MLYSSVPMYFKFKMNKLLPSDQIIKGELINNQTVKTSFHNGYMLIEKFVPYHVAIECLNEEIWKIV